MTSAACAPAALACRHALARSAWAAAGSLLLSVAPAAGIEPAPPRVVFLDVGQGDATLVQGLRGNVLVDAGTAIPDGFDAGRHVVVPALRALGVRRLDLVIASHSDLDHRGGLASVLDAMDVDRLWVPPGGRSDPAFAPLLARADRRGVRVQERGRGSRVEYCGDLRIETLWPPRHDTGVRSSNDASIVVRVAPVGEAGRGELRRVLLPGDIEAGAEDELGRVAGELDAHVLKLPHHGSRSSTSAAFLAGVAPRFAVASAPLRSRFGMPHEEVRARVRASGVRLLWTGRDGAVLIGLGPGLPVRRWGVD